MARPQDSTFDPILSYLQEQNVAAYNWCFVAGKTQSILSLGEPMISAVRRSEIVLEELLIRGDQRGKAIGVPVRLRAQISVLHGEHSHHWGKDPPPGTGYKMQR